MREKMFKQEKSKSKQPTASGASSGPDLSRVSEAIVNNNIADLEDLDRQGFDFSTHSASDGATLLILAARHGCIPALAFLAKRAQLESVDNSGINAISSAIRIASVDSLRILLAAGANPSATALDNAPPLLLAIEMGSAKMVNMLIDAGANPLDVNRYGQTGLMLAASGGEGSDAALIFDKMLSLSNIAAVDVNGDSALMFAIGPAAAKRIPQLVMAGLSPSQSNISGETPLDRAREIGSRRIEELLEACALAHAEQCEIEQLTNPAAPPKSRPSRI